MNNFLCTDCGLFNKFSHDKIFETLKDHLYNDILNIVIEYSCWRVSNTPCYDCCNKTHSNYSSNILKSVEFELNGSLLSKYNRFQLEIYQMMLSPSDLVDIQTSHDLLTICVIWVKTLIQSVFSLIKLSYDEYAEIIQLSINDMDKKEKIIHIMLPFSTEHAEKIGSEYLDVIIKL